jgi:hypothetical protein
MLYRSECWNLTKNRTINSFKQRKWCVRGPWQVTGENNIGLSETEQLRPALQILNILGSVFEYHVALFHHLQGMDKGRFVKRFCQYSMRDNRWWGWTIQRIEKRILSWTTERKNLINLVLSFMMSCRVEMDVKINKTRKKESLWSLDLWFLSLINCFRNVLSPNSNYYAFFAVVRARIIWKSCLIIPRV